MLNHIPHTAGRSCRDRKTAPHRLNQREWRAFKEAWQHKKIMTRVNLCGSRIIRNLNHRHPMSKIFREAITNLRCRNPSPRTENPIDGNALMTPVIASADILHLYSVAKSQRRGLAPFCCSPRRRIATKSLTRTLATYGLWMKTPDGIVLERTENLPDSNKTHDPLVCG